MDRRLVLLGLACALGGLGGCGGADGLRIESAILRNRVVVLDTVVMRKALYVAFSVGPGRGAEEILRVEGRLLHEGSVLSESAVSLRKERTGNLVFDLPYEIPDGAYTIAMQGLDERGGVIRRGARSVDRSELWSGAGVAPEPDRFEEIPPAREAGGQPDQPVRRLAARTVRNASTTFSLAIDPERAAGALRVRVSELSSKEGRLPSERVRVACVEAVPDATGAPKGSYRLVPELLRPARPNGSLDPGCSRIWITIRVGHEVVPGHYSGSLTLIPERAVSAEVPIELTVTPIVLEEVPGVDYCMLMTYEFTELAMPWPEEEKRKIRVAAAAVFKDYRDHGMTTVCLHSPFVLTTGKDGTPALDDAFAALRAARDAGFARPIVWYMGHLVQTSKPRHPGSILGFDPDTHLARLRYLVETVTRHARTHGYGEVVFLPIDEPDDASQDPGGRRLSLAPALVKAIREAGAKSMVTGERYEQLGRPDYLASSRLDASERDRAHAGGARYWVYENRVTTECTSPAFARYHYGYFAWQNHLDGMSSWTFQNTQNAAGPPGRANAPGRTGRDVYLAYPAPRGPVPTLRWEAIREGIDDYRLVYQLVKRVERMKQEGRDSAEYEAFLDRLRGETLEPCCDASLCSAEETRAFGERREALITMILRAQQRLR